MAANNTAAKSTAKASKPAAKASVPAARESGFLELPLGKLVLSTKNVRIKPHSESSLTMLSASIKTNGVLNPLLVSPNADGTYAVQAGGGRFDALHLLCEQGEASLETMVPCRLVEADQATVVSLTENLAREDMHPADVYESYRVLVDQGRSLNDIATMFGHTATTVERRLTLGKLHPVFLDMFRRGQIAQDQCMQLARIENPDEQLAIWESLKLQGSTTLYYLREAIDEQSVPASDPLAKYVSVEVYEAAGGKSTRDLFADEDESSIRLHDRPLLLQLAHDKLNVTAERVKAEGWAWVRVSVGSGLQSWHFTTPRMPEHPEDEQIAEWLAELDKDEIDSEDESEHEALRARIVALETLIEAREAELNWTAEAKAEAGALVVLYRGSEEITRGLYENARSRQQAIEANAEILGVAIEPNDDGEGASVAGVSQVKARGDYSAALVQDFNAHISAAMRNKIAQHPHAAVALMVASMMASTSLRFVHANGRPSSRIASDATGYNDTQAAKEWADIQAAIPQPEGNGLYIRADDCLVWALKLTPGQALQVFAAQMAECFDANLREAEDKALTTLADFVGLDMRDYWNAGTQNFCGAVSKQVMGKALDEAGEGGIAAQVQSLKKAEAVALAASTLKNTCWLPMPMRF